MNYEKKLGMSLGQGSVQSDKNRLIQYINLKLSALGQPIYGNDNDSEFLEIAQSLISSHQEKNRLLADYLCPVDQRIQDFLNDYLKDCEGPTPKLPSRTFILDRHGLARTMSVPGNKDSFVSDIISSYRIKQGILHNPKNDRRTTKGVFHVTEGGLPIPDDKLAVPKNVFQHMLGVALRPPKDLLKLPFTSGQEKQAEHYVSLLLRPMVCPEVPGVTKQKSTEIRFFAPASMISNLDFVESIFGNAGDPYLPENDAGLDTEHWTGHSGCVILAPHLITVRKKDAGLPHYDDATERQRKNGMCWKDENELYNNGGAFKITCRDERGIMVTIIADNYFGYCKKEVKTQISYSTNLYGLTEEEHAGGALAFPSYDLGEEFHLDDSLPKNNATIDDVFELYKDILDIQPEGYGVDKTYDSILYVPENAVFNIPQKSITWKKDGKEQKIRLLAFHTYILPSGYKIRMEKQSGGPNWRLIGTVGEGTLCHKPCTVSGGGKSEISKSIADAMIAGPVFTADFHQDLDQIESILKRDFGDRFSKQPKEPRPSRPILSPKRSLGSVIKLFTPSSEFTDEYNAWLESVHPHIKEMVFVIKRHYRPEQGDDWRKHLSVDVVNGYLGHELKYANQKLVANYLRVGREKDGSWRIYKLRQDFNAAQKVQSEDDISVSIVTPKETLENLSPAYSNPSVKIVKNCENRLFQRPDDAIHRGYDKQAEEDLSADNAFLSNYEPLTREEAKEIVEDAVGFEQYTEPMKELILSFIKDNDVEFLAVSSHPRIVDGKPTKNPRYLQNRPDLMQPKETYLAEIGTRLFRKIPMDKPVHLPVNAVLPGRRNNPPDRELGIPPLAVYNPIHYQELPELFVDFICSVTGKSPSTTGFGSEGALTKGPFNALWQTADLNTALVSYILTGYEGFSSAAGYIGPNYKVEHDISLLIPEIWSRMTVAERDPQFLIENGYLEKLEDFDHQGKTVKASLLGYRITIRFVHAFLGRIFNNPHAVFNRDMLKPEEQDLDIFAEGMECLLATQERVAKNYITDGSVEAACPPLKALLYIMAEGEYEGKDLNHPEIRKMFTREYLLASDWYQDRLKTKQLRDKNLWEKHIAYLERYLTKAGHAETIVEMDLHERLNNAKAQLASVLSDDYLKNLVGTLGADPLVPSTAEVQTSK